MDDMDERVLAAIRRIAEVIQSDQVSVNDYVRHRDYDSEPSQITAIRRFGTWSKAVQAAGLSPNPGQNNKKVPDKDALNAVRRAAREFSRETGKLQSEMTQHWYNQWRMRQIGDDFLGLAVLSKRWGGWAQVKDAANVPDKVARAAPASSSRTGSAKSGAKKAAVTKSASRKAVAAKKPRRARPAK